MLVGVNGAPLPPSEDGPTGRYVKVFEVRTKGKVSYGVEFEGVDMLESFQMLGDAIRGVAEHARSLAAEKRAVQQANAKLAEMRRRDGQ